MLELSLGQARSADLVGVKIRYFLDQLSRRGSQALWRIDYQGTYVCRERFSKCVDQGTNLDAIVCYLFVLRSCLSEAVRYAGWERRDKVFLERLCRVVE